jgi:cyclophilin family peptidyl-prolyl cis-trans isomerase
MTVLAVIAVLVVGGAFLASRGGRSRRTAASTTTTVKPARAGYGTTECPKPDGSSPKTASFRDSFKKCIDPAKRYTAKVETDAGAFTIELDPAKAPVTVNNFVSLARFQYYDGITFHRVIPGFVIQGGDPQGTGTGGPGYQFADELPRQGEYRVGSLAMANSGRDTNGSQFFVITGDQGVALPPNYALFGQVTSGLDVVKKIEADGDPSGTPRVVHKMTKVTITEG